ARPVVAARTWLVSAYLLASVIGGAVWVAAIAAGVLVGVGLATLWVGVLLLAVLPWLWRWGARLERLLVSAVFEVRISATYRAAPHGSLLRRGRIIVTDPATWKDLAYLILLLPL